MKKGISYLNRNFDDYKNALIEFTKQYYPELANNFSDASIGSWLVDINADIADSLSYHIDRVFQETNINEAQEFRSILNMARTNGFKVPGPKASIAEVRFTCDIPATSNTEYGSLNNGDMKYAPIIKKGTIVSSGNIDFELLYDIDFSKQFNEFGISDRTHIPIKNSNGDIIFYRYAKLGLVSSAQTRVMEKKISSGDVKPFMEIVLPGKNVISVESIIQKPGQNYKNNPSMSEFLRPEEITGSGDSEVVRFFEVDSLSDQYRWGDVVKDGNPVKYRYNYNKPVTGETGNITYDEIPVYEITKGEWKPLKHKFITEYTDKGFLKIIFGPGMEDGIDNIDISEASDFSKYKIAKMLKNSSLGVLPDMDTTLYILYKAGGGRETNVPKDSITNISYLKVENRDNCVINLETMASVRNTITVTNTTPSVSGKDAPTAEELKYMIKYFNAAQNRCVTLKDYKSRIMNLPPEYGTPFRVGVIEENNKIMIYLLSIDYNGNVTASIPEILVRNIESYLDEYRTINDFVEIKSGKVINISFEISVHTDKGVSTSDIKDAIKKTVIDYMDINKREMGDDVYVGDLERKIGEVAGVKNVIYVKAFNKRGEGYSPIPISQIRKNNLSEGGFEEEIDLEDSEKIIYSDGDSIIELKYPESDITIITKTV